MRGHFVENCTRDVVDKEQLAVLRPEDEPTLEREGETGTHDIRAEKPSSRKRFERVNNQHKKQGSEGGRALLNMSKIYSYFVVKVVRMAVGWRGRVQNVGQLLDVGLKDVAPKVNRFDRTGPMDEVARPQPTRPVRQDPKSMTFFDTPTGCWRSCRERGRRRAVTVKGASSAHRKRGACFEPTKRSLCQKCLPLMHTWG